MLLADLNLARRDYSQTMDVHSKVFCDLVQNQNVFILGRVWVTFWKLWTKHDALIILHQKQKSNVFMELARTSAFMLLNVFTSRVCVCTPTTGNICHPISVRSMLVRNQLKTRFLKIVLCHFLLVLCTMMLSSNWLVNLKPPFPPYRENRLKWFIHSTSFTPYYLSSTCSFTLYFFKLFHHFIPLICCHSWSFSSFSACLISDCHLLV